MLFKAIYITQPISFETHFGTSTVGKNLLGTRLPRTRLHINLSDLSDCAIMYEAFELIRIVEKLPLKITSLATWGEPL